MQKKVYEKVEKKSREETAAAIQRAKEMADECRNAADYAGSYEHKAYGKAEVAERDGKLFLSMIGLALPLLATGQDQFYLVVESYELCFPVSFEREKDGSVQALMIPLEAQLKTYRMGYRRQSGVGRNAGNLPEYLFVAMRGRKAHEEKKRKGTIWRNESVRTLGSLCDRHGDRASAVYDQWVYFVFLQMSC